MIPPPRDMVYIEGGIIARKLGLWPDHQIAKGQD